MRENKFSDVNGNERIEYDFYDTDSQEQKLSCIKYPDKIVLIQGNYVYNANLDLIKDHNIKSVINFDEYKATKVIIK